MSLVNVSTRLSHFAQASPDQLAVVAPGKHRGGQRQYSSVTFADFEADVNRIASGLAAAGITPGMRLVLMVPPSIEFIALTFALLKAGVVVVLIDPGMPKRNLLTCLDEVEPDGFVAIPLAHVVRVAMGRRYARAKHNITVGRRWFWGGKTLDQIKALGTPDCPAAQTTADDHAAIIFTTGSTGPPKGVLYRHGNFDQQVAQIQQQYGIEPGEIDLPGFPLFGLFNAAMGVTTVLPDMNPTRPAEVNPENIIEAIRDWDVTQAFASPALWNVVGNYCDQNEVKLPTLRRVLSAGAPVPPPVLNSMTRAIAPGGLMHTPYGATEALPVATISSAEVLGETATLSNTGAGTCVGSRFAGITWRVIEISDEPIADISQTVELPQGEIGEIIVRGPQVTTEYVTRTEANPLHKITDTTGDAPHFWHRMGDVGYLDEQDRFWFCGRKAHRVTTKTGPMFTVPCEAIFNQHPAVRRSALVGIGPAGEQEPVLIVELEDPDSTQAGPLIHELSELAQKHELTRRIDGFMVHSKFPVDIRHNAKIFREKLAVWAAQGGE